MRALLAFVLSAGSVLGCPCLGVGSPCSGMAGSTVVFVGRVVVDSGEGLGKGPARVEVEEGLLNVPEGLKEVEVNTSAGTSYYYRLKQGERYVIFADKEGEGPLRLSLGRCSSTFRVENNEHLLDALRNQAQGGPARLVGKVLRSSGGYGEGGVVAGARVVAESGSNRYEALTSAFGVYEIRGMSPGRYRLEVSKPGYVPDDEFNHRRPAPLVLSETTKTYQRETGVPPGSIVVPEDRCEVWDLSLWQRGRISGRVRSMTGEALGGVTVQAFGVDQKGNRDSWPLRRGKTDDQGRYLIEPLPGGEYVVGVNAAVYEDADEYPPTVFGGEAGSRVVVTDGGEVTGIDLALPPKRVATTLSVRVLGPEGGAYTDAIVRLENLAGVERGASGERGSREGIVEIRVYVGEQYVVKARDYPPRAATQRDYDYLEGMARVDIRGPGAVATVVLTKRRWDAER